MHPNEAFHWTDRGGMLSFVADHPFAHIFTASDGQLFVVHAPVLVTGTAIQFHVSRRNRIAEHIDGRPVLISVVGRHGYQSANWYASGNQVPTWHYESVEAEGQARRMDDDQLVSLLDALSDVHEGRVQPDRPWTRAKMEPGCFEAMTKAVVGFEVEAVALRGTRKFNQHKSAQDVAATIVGQRTAGRGDIAAAVAEARPERS